MAKTEYFEKQRDSLDSSDIPIKKWWKTLRNLSGLPCNSSNYPPLLLNDTYITKDIEKAYAFNDYFCQQSLIDDSNSDISASTPAINRPMIEQIILSQEELYDCLLLLDVSKATGPDGISPRTQISPGSAIQ